MAAKLSRQAGVGKITLHWPERKILLVGDALVGDGEPIPQFAEQQLPEIVDTFPI
jgi:hypothetical protein